LASREGAAEGECGGNSAAPERSAGAKRRRSVPFKIGSDFVKQTHQNLTFRNFANGFCRAKRGKVWKHWLAAHGAARQAQVRNPLRF